MTVVVNLRNDEEEKVLIAFLYSLEYDYQTIAFDIAFTGAQKKEITRREKSFVEGKTTARSWDEIKKELEGIYR